MYITNKELELLLEIENKLFTSDMGLYLKLYELNERLITARDKNNERNTKRIAEKRKDNKMYGRGAKEKQAHEQAIKNRKND